MPYQVTLSAGGAPNCAGVYTEHVEFNGQMSYVCTNEVGTWYLFWSSDQGYVIAAVFFDTVPRNTKFWRAEEHVWGVITGEYLPWGGATGTATVAEVVEPAPAAAVQSRSNVSVGVGIG